VGQRRTVCKAPQFPLNHVLSSLSLFLSIISLSISISISISVYIFIAAIVHTRGIKIIRGGGNSVHVLLLNAQ
jgi:hypothetical protein